MPLVDAFILGVIQALTEFLPISSSGHLLLAHEALGLGAGQTNEQKFTFDVALHAGTLAAIVVYFWRDIFGLFAAGLASVRDRSLAGDPMRRLAWLILLASIPAGLCGVLAEDVIEEKLRSPWIVATLMIVFALLLFLAEKAGRQVKDLKKVSLADALTVGVAQALALVPGVSRSGVTITAGLFRHLERDTAARFSFLLGGPVTAGAIVFKVGKLLQQGVPAEERAAFAVGIISSAAFGFLAIWFLLRFLRTHTTHVFVVYRIILGAVIFAWLFGRG